MIDYYPVLARAAATINSADPVARKHLYERARRLVITQLRKQDPQISEEALRREQAALEAAVRRIEAEIPEPASKEKVGQQNSPDGEIVTVVFRDMPKGLAALLFGTAYIATVIAFSGVIFLEGLALVYAGVIPYPLLLGATAAVGFSLVLLSRTVFRKLRM